MKIPRKRSMAPVGAARSKLTSGAVEAEHDSSRHGRAEMAPRSSRRSDVTPLTAPARAFAEAAGVLRTDRRALFDDWGNLRPVHELPDQLAAALASVKIVRRGRHLLLCVRFRDQYKILEMLMKHFGLFGAGGRLSGEENLSARPDGNGGSARGDGTRA